MVELIQYALMVSVRWNTAIHSRTRCSCGGFARASQAVSRVFQHSQHFFFIRIFTLVWFLVFIHPNDIAVCPFFAVELSKLWLAQLESMEAPSLLVFFFFFLHVSELKRLICSHSSIDQWIRMKIPVMQPGARINDWSLASKRRKTIREKNISYSSESRRFHILEMHSVAVASTTN